MKRHRTMVTFLGALAVLSQARTLNPTGADSHVTLAVNGAHSEAAPTKKASNAKVMEAKAVPAAPAKKVPAAPKLAKAKAVPPPVPPKPKMAAPKKEKIAAKVVAKAKVAAPAKAPMVKSASPPASPQASLRAPTKAELVKAKAASPAKATKPVASTKAAALVSYSPRLSPPLHDGGEMGGGAKHQSDKKFFGPPFPADYPDDKRPVPDQKVMDKLKGPGQPYPALQTKDQFDRDYVKDENSDQGSWKAQFEYDSLRNKMAKEAADAKRAGGRADKEGRDADDAQGRADKAARDVDDANREVREAVTGEEEAKKAEDFEDVPPSQQKLEDIKKAVKQAEENLEKEKKEFEQCKKALEEAKKNLEELKAAQVAMEQKLAADTKLWVESKQVRLNLQKSKQDAAHSKHLAADERLKAAQAAKAEVDQTLTTKKAQRDVAVKRLQKEKADVEQAKKDLERATLTLQKLRGYKPVEAKPARSDASTTSAVISLVFVAMTAF